MKIDLTYKEANLLRAILWEVGSERATVLSAAPGADVWRLTDRGADLCAGIATKLEEANDAVNQKMGKDRDLSGSPKGTIQEARWLA